MKFSYLFYEPISELRELASRMQAIASLDYQGIELTATHPFAYDFTDLATAIETSGIPVVSLLSGWSYANEGLCLASPDAGIRRRAINRLIEYVNIAGNIGSLLVVGLMQGLRSDEKDASVANARIVAALTEVAHAAEACGVVVVIEPVNHLQVGFNHTAAEVMDLVQRIESPAVTLMLDTIHMNIEERSMLDTIRRYAHRIGHFHLCESNGGLFGSGNLDINAVLAALQDAEYEKYISIKVYRHPDWLEAARHTRDYLKAIGW